MRGIDNVSATLERRLLLVRHGLPDYRLGKRQDEPPGPVLSEIGRSQAQQAIAVVAPYEPQAVYTSPLARTRQTADIIAAALGRRAACDQLLAEWHRTESIYEVSLRCGTWLRRWLAGGQRCAVAVSHGSPLMSIIREALYLPHLTWWRSDAPDRLRLDTPDRLETSMASVFEVLFTPRWVEARCLHHPRPRITHIRRGRPVPGFERPAMHLENTRISRPNLGRLIGWRDSAA